MNIGEISNSITYDGEVSFKFRKNGRIYSSSSHNAGTKFLRDLLCRVLCDSKCNESDIPRYINFYLENENGTKISLLKGKLLISTKTYGESVGSNDEQSVLLLKTTMSYDDMYPYSEVNSIEYSNGNVDAISNFIGDSNSAALILSLENANTQNNNNIVLATIIDNYSYGTWDNGNLRDLYNSIVGSGHDTGVDALIEWRLVFKNGGNR